MPAYHRQKWEGSIPKVIPTGAKHTLHARWRRKHLDERTGIKERYHVVREYLDAAQEEARIMGQELPRKRWVLHAMLFVATLAADWGFKRFAAWLSAVAIKYRATS